MHQFGHAALPLGRAQFAVEIFAGDDVGGGLRPVRRDFDVALLEDYRAFIVADGGVAGLPLHIVIGGFAGLQTSGKVFREFHPGVFWFGRVLDLQLFYYRICGRFCCRCLAHRSLLPAVFKLWRICNLAPRCWASSIEISI